MIMSGFSTTWIHNAQLYQTGCGVQGYQLPQTRVRTTRNLVQTRDVRTYGHNKTILDVVYSRARSVE